MTIKVETNTTCEVVIPSKNQNVMADITEYFEGRYLTVKIGDLITRLIWNPTQLKYRGQIGGFEILTNGPKTSVKIVQNKTSKKRR